MEIYKLYESLIREEVTGGVQACVAKYGKELFGPQLGGDEPNTDVEDNSVDRIYNFTTQHYGGSISSEFGGNVDDLKKCMSAFPEVLHPEGEVYRGLSLSLEQILPYISKIDAHGHFQFEYNARTRVQSWTESFEVADDFAAASVNKFTINFITNVIEPGSLNEKIQDYINNGLMVQFKIPVVLKHNATPDQFLFKAKYFSLLSASEDEDEILRIDNKPTMMSAEIRHDYELGSTDKTVIEFLHLIVNALNKN
jgi:hypothetical protein